VADGLVHQIRVEHQPIDHHSQAHFNRWLAKRMAPMKKSLHPHHFDQLLKLATQNSATLNAVNKYGNITLGTPPQNFIAKFDDTEEVVYFISPENNFDYWYTKARYYQNESSTGANSDLTFSDYWSDAKGHVVTDVINLNGVEALVNVGVADTDNGYSSVQWSHADAVFGLHVAILPDDDSRSNVSVLRQIAGQLDQPVVTVLARLSNASDHGSVSTTGQITIGALDVVNCESNYAITPKYNQWNYASLLGVSVGSYSNNSLNDDILAADEWHRWHYVNNDLFDALIAATNAVDISPAPSEKPRNHYYDTFTVDCASVSSFPPIVLTLGGNVQVEVRGEDYVELQSDGTCLLAVSPYGDGAASINLGLNFLTNNCFADFYNVGQLGFSRVRSVKA